MPKTIKNEKFWYNLRLRLLAGLFFVPVFLIPIYHGGFWLLAMLVLVGVLMAREWLRLLKQRRDYYWLWLGLGFLYIALPLYSLYQLRLWHDGFALLLWLLVVVVATDTMAYAIGNLCGGRKLAPAISPGKTISGFLGGITGGACISAVFAGWYDTSWVLLLALGLFLAILSQCSDLCESAIKRYFGVKDSGRIIPGHGGILDRTDSLILPLPLVYLACLLANENILFWP
jgi:phosphatidate cytidylyltransferase